MHFHSPHSPHYFSYASYFLPSPDRDAVFFWLIVIFVPQWGVVIRWGGGKFAASRQKEWKCTQTNKKRCGSHPGKRPHKNQNRVLYHELLMCDYLFTIIRIFVAIFICNASCLIECWMLLLSMILPLCVGWIVLVSKAFRLRYMAYSGSTDQLDESSIWQIYSWTSHGYVLQTHYRFAWLHLPSST